MKIGIRARLGRSFFLVILVATPAMVAASSSDECNVKAIADKVKTIRVLRQIENSMNFLALSQADAIVDIATGVHTLELYNNESGFYGPLGGLRKATDKNEAVLNGLDKEIHRLSTFESIKERYGELRVSVAQIVTAGYEVLGELEDGDAAEAARIYASVTVVAMNEARADAYTAMSGFEKNIALAGVSCR